MSDSLQPHGLQHTRPPCASPPPGVYSNSCPLSQWCHPIISSSVILFSSHPQSFPASGSFQISQFFTSGGQSIAAGKLFSSVCWDLTWAMTGSTGHTRPKPQVLVSMNHNSGKPHQGPRWHQGPPPPPDDAKVKSITTMTQGWVNHHTPTTLLLRQKTACT